MLRMVSKIATPVVSGPVDVAPDMTHPDMSRQDNGECKGRLDFQGVCVDEPVQGNEADANNP